MATPILDKIDFKTKIMLPAIEGYFIMIKELIYQDDRTIINIFKPNDKAPKIHKAKVNKTESRAT